MIAVEPDAPMGATMQPPWGVGELLPLHRLRELEQGPDNKELAALEAMEISQVVMEMQEAKGVHPGVEDHHKDRLVAIVVQTT